MSAAIIAFPTPAAPDAEEVRALLVRLRRQGVAVSSVEPSIGAMRVWSACESRGWAVPNIGTVIEELKREQEAESWLPADVIEFPPELRVEPLRTLGAEWHYLTARANYHKAIHAGQDRPLPPSRAWANEAGDSMKLGLRVSKRYAREVAEAADYLREHVDGPCDQTQRDEWMLTWLSISFDGAGREVSPALRKIQRAARQRAGWRKPRRALRFDGPGAA